MKQSEKLDLILKDLYKFKYDGNYHSIADVFRLQNIPLDIHVELKTLVHRLKNDGFIKVMFMKDDCFGELTSHGIEYCEESSYTYKGSAVITNNYNLTITNSPNANIVSNSSNVNIAINNYGDIKTKISEIREAVNSSVGIDEAKKQEIIDCVDEVENNIDAGKKPKFSFSSLSHLAGSLAEVGLLVIELGKLIFGGH